ncbi:MAG TPA: hypothetical protein VMZ31_12885 [Phycisphaerae bacterium]|nr:hypothetical protein [Phycisphaerae bacterium]
MVSRKAVRIRQAGLACVLAAGVLILGFLGNSLYAASDELSVQTAASKTVSDVPAEQICPTCPDIYETQASGVFCPTAATIMLTSLMAGLSLAGRRTRR